MRRSQYYSTTVQITGYNLPWTCYKSVLSCTFFSPLPGGHWGGRRGRSDNTVFCCWDCSTAVETSQSRSCSHRARSPGCLSGGTHRGRIRSSSNWGWNTWRGTDVQSCSESSYLWGRRVSSPHGFLIQLCVWPPRSLDLRLVSEPRLRILPSPQTAGLNSWWHLPSRRSQP